MLKQGFRFCLALVSALIQGGRCAVHDELCHGWKVLEVSNLVYVHVSLKDKAMSVWELGYSGCCWIRACTANVQFIYRGNVPEKVHGVHPHPM